MHCNNFSPTIYTNPIYSFMKHKPILAGIQLPVGFGCHHSAPLWFSLLPLVLDWYYNNQETAYYLLIPPYGIIISLSMLKTCLKEPARVRICLSVTYITLKPSTQRTCRTFLPVLTACIDRPAQATDKERNFLPNWFARFINSNAYTLLDSTRYNSNM